MERLEMYNSRLAEASRVLTPDPRDRARFALVDADDLRDLALVADDLLILLNDSLDFGEVLRLAGGLAADLDRLARVAGGAP